MIMQNYDNNWDYGFKGTINWNEFQSKVTTERQNKYLDYLINLGFQGLKRHFILSFENNAYRTGHIGYFLPKVEIKDYDLMVNGKSFLISQEKIIWKHMITLKKFQLVKETITQLVAN